jgi:microcystin-dependent protein
MYGGTVLPTGYLWCNGQAVSRTTYSALFAICGTTYGSGDGSTTFNLPNMQEVVPMGRRTMGGASSPGLVTSASTGGSNANVLGAKGGAETNTLTEDQLPPHAHDYETPSSYAASVGSGGTSGIARIQTTGTTQTTGGGQPHSNTQPWIAMNFIIKT